MTFLKGMDIIFCCNVLIFSIWDRSARSMQHFYSKLLPGGYMFRATPSRCIRWTTDFTWWHFPGPSVLETAGWVHRRRQTMKAQRLEEIRPRIQALEAMPAVPDRPSA